MSGGFARLVANRDSAGKSGKLVPSTGKLVLSSGDLERRSFRAMSLPAPRVTLRKDGRHGVRGSPACRRRLRAAHLRELARRVQELASGSEEGAPLDEPLQAGERDQLRLGDRKLEALLASPAHRIVQAVPPPARPGAVYRPSGVRLAAMGPADDLRDLLVPGSLAPLGRPADPLELEDPLVRESQVVGEKEIERLARAALPREMQKDRAKAVR